MVDDGKDIARKYRVMSIPTMILFENGNEAKRLVGLHQKSQLKEELGYNKIES